MNALTPQHAPHTRTPGRARVRRDHSPAWPDRQLRDTDAIVQNGRIERRLVHPVGGLEGYSPAEVRAEQMRTRERDRPEAVTHYLSVES
jgi:hypothetical protein